MERLTEYFELGAYTDRRNNIIDVSDKLPLFENGVIMGKAVDRLAEFEDFMEEQGCDSLDSLKNKIDNGEFSDGYHTFNELYEFRKLYNALLFNEWAKNEEVEVYKSKRHYDNKECFGGGWFIVVAMLPSGQISNHYELKDWDLFDIPEYEKSKYEFDGHTPEDVRVRMISFLRNKTCKV